MKRAVRRAQLKQAAKLSAPSRESVDAVHTAVLEVTGLVPRPGEGVTELVARACKLSIDQLNEIRGLVKAGASAIEAQRRATGCDGTNEP